MNWNWFASEKVIVDSYYAKKVEDIVEVNLWESISLKFTVNKSFWILNSPAAKRYTANNPNLRSVWSLSVPDKYLRHKDRYFCTYFAHQCFRHYRPTIRWLKGRRTYPNILLMFWSFFMLQIQSNENIRDKKMMQRYVHFGYWIYMYFLL